jgi:hypothetical protein
MIFEYDKDGRKILFRQMNGKERSEFRAHLYRKQEGICHWCKEKMLLVDFLYNVRNISNNQSDVATFEHLQDDWAIPNGKDHTTVNIKLACAGCNQSRAELRHRVFMEYLLKEFGGDRLAMHEFIRDKKPRALFPKIVKDREELIELLSGVYFSPIV